MGHGRNKISPTTQTVAFICFLVTYTPPGCFCWFTVGGFQFLDTREPVEWEDGHDLPIESKICKMVHRLDLLPTGMSMALSTGIIIPI